MGTEYPWIGHLSERFAEHVRLARAERRYAARRDRAVQMLPVPGCGCPVCIAWTGRKIYREEETEGGSP